MLRNGSLGKSLIFFFHKHEVTQWCCYHVWIPSVDLDVKPLQCLEDDSELLRQPILFVCGWFSSERNCREWIVLCEHEEWRLHLFVL
uniref:Uncharacterized protein n=1 Tax=Salix viminalis TaxID=40686 RepID=A0A6N2MR15_SALVM